MVSQMHGNRNKSFIIFPLLILIVLSTALYTISAQSQNLILPKVDKKVDDPLQQEFDKKIQEWIEYCRSQPEVAFSSNPGTAANNEQYKAIENLGVEYLPYLIRYIEENQNGFASSLIYVTQKKAKVYMKEHYSNPENWSVLWNRYLKSVPENVKSIKSEMQKDNSPENLKAKTEELAQLGVPAIPFIMDEVKAGDENMVKALNVIQADASALSADKDMARMAANAVDAEDKYKGIKELVLSVK